MKMADMSLENQRFIDENVASGRYASRAAAIDEAVRLLRAEAQGNGRNGVNELSPEQWCERFEAWAVGHRELLHEADDSRESIYAGQGE
jgi:Arc/MetJ-type ribon-helix-helix transcriptional regulator